MLGAGSVGGLGRSFKSEDMKNELSMGVKNLAMNGDVSDLNTKASEDEEDSKIRVSGLNSYDRSLEVPSSGDSKHVQERLSIGERLQIAKDQKASKSKEKKPSPRGLNAAAKEIDKQKKTR